MPDPIGLFVIGSSGVGDVPFSWQDTLLSQYANSPTLLQLIENMDGYINPDVDIFNFFDMVWNVDTAVGWGLDVWGRIVNIGRVLNVANDLVFGFEEATTASASPFNQGVFYNGGPSTGNYRLSDAAYRLLILAKALSNISDGSIPAINQILLNLFPNRGNCYVTNGMDMTITYHFTFALSSVELAILEQTDVLPTPAGVSFTVVTP